MHEGPRIAIKEKFYRDYTHPLLSEKPMAISFWFNHAWKAWLLSVNKEDLENVKFNILFISLEKFSH